MQGRPSWKSQRAPRSDQRSCRVGCAIWEHESAVRQIEIPHMART
ncbi:unnamed protein product [Ixodes pacificus]